MKKLLAVLLSYTLIFTSVAPALAGGGGGLRRAAKAASESSVKKLDPADIQRMLEVYRRIPTAPVLAGKNVSLMSLATGLDYAKNGVESTSSVVDQVFSYEGKTVPLTEEQLTNLTTGKASVADLTAAQRDFFYKAGLLEQLSEKGVIPSTAVVDNAMAYYRRTLVESSNAAEVMGAVTNMGLMSVRKTKQSAKDADAILKAAQKFGEEFDQIAAHALIDMGADTQLQALADLRLTEAGSLRKTWSEYARVANLHRMPLRMPEISTMRELPSWDMPLQRELGAQNPYSLLFWSNDPDINFSLHNSLRTQVQTAIAEGTIAEIEQQVLRDVNAQLNVKEVKATPVDGSFSSTIPSAKQVELGQPLWENNSFLLDLQAPGKAATQAAAPVNTAKEVEKGAEQAEKKVVDLGTPLPGREAVEESSTFAPKAVEPDVISVRLAAEDASSSVPVTFKFKDEKTKALFAKRLHLQPDEFLMFDPKTSTIIIRQELTKEQIAAHAKPRDRGFDRLFFEGNQEAVVELHKIALAKQLAPKLTPVTDEASALALLKQYRAEIRNILSSVNVKEFALLKDFLNASEEALPGAEKALLKSEDIVTLTNALSFFIQAKALSPLELEIYTDDIGVLAIIFSGLGEGTLGTMGQAQTASLALLGIIKGFLSNLPTAAGQFGPAWAPFIAAWQAKYGARRLLSIGQLLGAGGHLSAAASLALGALGYLPPLAAFAGMVGGIVVNGVAGSILKQVNPLVIKQRAPERITVSEMTARANSAASVGGMYCYLFLPIVGGISTALFGVPVGLGTLAAMFGVAAAAPLTANVLLRKSKIKNVPTATQQTSVFKEIGNNLRFGFRSRYLRRLLFATAGGHFMGLGFNSGPGTFFKHTIENPSVAMLTSFASIYLTVYLGRKLGAIMMKRGVISDKALAGLSSIIGLTAGGISMLPGLGIIGRSIAWATAGLGFANWANVLQSIELNRPENKGKEGAVSTMYILARTSGMLTMLMGAFADKLGPMLGVSPTTATVAALSLPWAAGLISTLINRRFISEDLWPTAKRWGTELKDKVKGWFQKIQRRRTVK